MLSIEDMSFAIPTGAAGHVTSAVLARLLGLPVRRLLVGTNANDMLPHFVNTASLSACASGCVRSHAPSMDIAIPYNLERLLFLAGPRKFGEGEGRGG